VENLEWCCFVTEKTIILSCREYYYLYSKRKVRIYGFAPGLEIESRPAMFLQRLAAQEQEDTAFTFLYEACRRYQ
jgi:hypothetical protein